MSSADSNKKKIYCANQTMDMNSGRHDLHHDSVEQPNHDNDMTNLQSLKAFFAYVLSKVCTSLQGTTEVRMLRWMLHQWQQPILLL